MKEASHDMKAVDANKKQLENALEDNQVARVIEAAKVFFKMRDVDELLPIKERIALKSRVNQCLHMHHHRVEEDYHFDEVKQDLDRFQSDDTDFLIKHYEMLYEQSKHRNHFMFSYDILMKLILSYRRAKQTSALTSAYQRVLDLMKRFESDVINAAKRLDGIACDFVFEEVRLHADPIEQSTWFKAIEPDVHLGIYESIGRQRRMGYVYSFWHEKQTILEEAYGIDWTSPQFLNDAKFD